ncbi:MAG: alpha/beta fold hydrolase [Gammaproteobacteria bacterium]|nr:alpha/beta fold hydrolase [Gammaproteobacteria bacterium]
MKIYLSTFILVILCALSTGCGFFALSKDLDKLDVAVSISGTVDASPTSGKPILVALYAPEENNKNRLKASAVRYGSGEFEFLVAKGRYYLIAFEDKNEDLTVQDDERIGWYGNPTLIETGSGERIGKLKVVLRFPDQAKQELPTLYSNQEPKEPLKLENERIGEIVDQNDPRFSQEIGNMGVWEPIKFVELGYNGIFFFEPYDAQKVPVLFVHGFSGSGHNWLTIINGLDRDRFQPWIVQYPSGLRLNLISRVLNEKITELQLRHSFEKLIVVAHSMGGLVSRGFINRNVVQEGGGVVDLFVTISTPWGGIETAQTGVDHTPVVVPSWYDLVPGNPYASSLFEQPLPDNVPYFLLFSYRGKGELISSSTNNSDGTVSIQSQLLPKAQDAATSVIGYDEGHVSILQNKRVVNKLNRIMADTLYK